MKNILETLSAVGALVLAATPLTAIGGFAHAADYQPVKIQVSDLDFSRPADAATFRHRVDIVARTMCTSSTQIAVNAACRSAVQDEAVERLGSAQRQDLRTAEASTGATLRVASE